MSKNVHYFELFLTVYWQFTQIGRTGDTKVPSCVPHLVVAS